MGFFWGHVFIVSSYILLLSSLCCPSLCMSTSTHTTAFPRKTLTLVLIRNKQQLGFFTNCCLLWFEHKEQVFVGKAQRQKNKTKCSDMDYESIDLCLETWHKRMSGWALCSHVPDYGLKEHKANTLLKLRRFGSGQCPDGWLVGKPHWFPY